MVGTKACGVAKRDLDFELGAVFEFLLQVHELGEPGRESLSLPDTRFIMSQIGEPDQAISNSLSPMLGGYDSNVCFSLCILLVTFP